MENFFIVLHAGLIESVYISQGSFVGDGREESWVCGMPGQR